MLSERLTKAGHYAGVRLYSTVEVQDIHILRKVIYVKTTVASTLVVMADAEESALLLITVSSHGP